MKKFDKEYCTQFNDEKDFLKSFGIKPTFIKVVDGVTNYKYKKSERLFRVLSFFYAEK
jgi:hypothetical protein